MNVTDRPEELRAWLDEARQKGATVGFHPTMGALHGGHTANIARAAAECDVVAVSIFVNPLQFGPGEDFAAYPRRLGDDLARAEEAGASFVLAPTPESMFKTAPLVTVSVADLGRRWEGEHRPGHFDGVATIVTKLLSIVGACYAYFGEKDYQQLVIVRRLVDDLSLPAVVVPCAIVREPDGLALSSRNSYLEQCERAAAPCLYWALLAGKRSFQRAQAAEAEKARSAMRDAMCKQDVFVLDYADVVDPRTLEPLEHASGEARLIIAARCASARLIDNISVNAEET